MDVKIRLRGGIGDCLKLLLIHHQVVDYCNQFKATCFVTYECSEVGGLPNQQVVKEVCERTTILKYIDETSYNNLDVQDLRTCNRKNLKCLGLELSLHKSEEIQFNNKKLSIAIQTRGMDLTKRWKPEKIKEIIECIDANIFDIYLIDRADYLTGIEFYFKDNINVKIPNHSFVQNYNTILNCNYLISPDSWSKYVMQSNNNLKMVLCCTLLPYISQEKMFVDCFHGIYNNQQTKIVGYRQDDKNVLVDDINDIPSEEIIEAFNSLVANAH